MVREGESWHKQPISTGKRKLENSIVFPGMSRGPKVSALTVPVPTGRSLWVAALCSCSSRHRVVVQRRHYLSPSGLRIWGEVFPALFWIQRVTGREVASVGPHFTPQCSSPYLAASGPGWNR